MKAIVTIFFSLVNFMLFCQVTEVEYGDSTLMSSYPGSSSYFFKNKIKDGNYEAYYKDGRLAVKVSVSNGLKEGFNYWYQYDENRILLVRTPYVKGKKHGLEIDYWIKDENVVLFNVSKWNNGIYEESILNEF